MGYEEELEHLRLEFVKRSKDPGAIYRAEKAFVRHKEEVLIIHDAANPATQQSGEGYDSPEGHGYTLTITFNMYATIDEIKAALLSQVMRRIEFGKMLMALDMPQSEKPTFKKGRGQKSPRSVIGEIESCLKIFDLAAEGKNDTDIAEIVYGNKRQTKQDQDAWPSDREKVYQKHQKALQLIVAAKNNDFPNIPGLKSKRNKTT